MAAPRDKDLLIEYAVRDLRGREQNGQLRTVKGIPFKTAAAARAYRAKLPTGTEFDPSRFGVYAVKGGFVLLRYARVGLGLGAIDPEWVGEDAAEAVRQRTARRARLITPQWIGCRSCPEGPHPAMGSRSPQPRGLPSNPLEFEVIKLLGYRASMPQKRKNRRGSEFGGLRESLEEQGFQVLVLRLLPCTTPPRLYPTSESLKSLLQLFVIPIFAVRRAVVA